MPVFCASVKEVFVGLETVLTAVGGAVAGAMAAYTAMLQARRINRESIGQAEERLRAELRADYDRVSERLDAISSRHWQLVDLVRRCPERGCPLASDIRSLDRRAPREEENEQL